MFVFVATGALAQNSSPPGKCSSALLSQQNQNALSPAQERLIADRYDLKPDAVIVSPNLKLPIVVKMTDHKTLAPKIDARVTPIREAKKYDVSIIAAGPAALMAAHELAEAGLRVVVFERNPQAGGLGMGSKLAGIDAGGGSAYFGNPVDDLEAEAYEKLGLDQVSRDRKEIHADIDNLIYKGRRQSGEIWLDETLKQLPEEIKAPFKMFKHALLYWSEKGADGHEAAARWADSMTMAQFVRQIPSMIAAWSVKDTKAAELLAEFHNSPAATSHDPMKSVLDLLSLYGPSALGGKPQVVSARAFIKFYTSEMGPRYTGTLGSGTITEKILEKLRKFPNVEIRTSAPVVSVTERDHQTHVVFVENGVVKEVVATYSLFAAPIPLALKLVSDLKQKDPEKARLISQMKMTDYVVHVVRIKGHPLRGAYDHWPIRDGVVPDTGIPIPYIDPEFRLPTDYINGRHVNPLINGYEGMRDFKTDPLDDYGVITIYHPLGPSDSRHFQKENLLALAENDILAMHRDLDPLAAENGQKIEVEMVESFIWPYAIHIVEPGSLTREPILSRPTGRIFYANNTSDVPEFETALAIGLREAKAIITKIQEDRAAPRTGTRP